MSYIKYSLTNVARLDTLAAVGVGALAAGHHPLPGTAGFYMIRNHTSDNRYVGKSGNLQERFDGRMLTINEFGLRTIDLAGIDVFWGTVAIYNTPGFAVPGAAGMAPPVMPAPAPAVVGANAFGLAPPRPAAELGALLRPAPNYGGNLVTSTIDGSIVNVEALLIRFFRMFGAAGSMTNLVYMGPFYNSTPNSMDVLVEWGAGVTTPIPVAHYEFQIPPNSNL